MAFEFKLPDIGEGVAEGEVVKWLVKAGDVVTEDQPIIEVMTDKATVEIASPKAGKISALKVKEGDVVPVGSVLVLIDESGDGQVIPIGSPKDKKTPAAGPTADTPLFSASPAPRPAVAMPSNMARPLASPATRKLAREMGVDLSALSASGPQGRVTRDDVMATRSAGAPQAAATAMRPATMPLPTRSTSAPSGGEERIPLRGIRKKIAEHMVKAKFTAPHFTQFDEIDMTELVSLKNSAKEMGAKYGIKITFLPFIVQVLCKVLKEYPMLNAMLDDAKEEIVVKHYYNIGIAAATDSGLIVPVVKNADQKSVLELARDIQVLGEKARTGKLAVEDLQGGTFTITSTGNSGGMMATPIINHPEVAILGINRIKETPVVRDGQIVIRQIGHFCLSLDHRVVDGAIGAAFLKRMIGLLEDPKLLLLHE